MPALALVLELHHPLPPPGRGAGPDWARSAVEVFWPLLMAIDDFAARGGDASITLAISPSWTALAADPSARRRVRRELERVGNGNRPLLRFLAEHGGDAMAPIRSWNASGAVSAIPTTASHAWLPSVAADPTVAAAQIGLAAADHASRFDARPAGVWLPFLAYAPGLETAMAARGLRFFGVAEHAFLRGTVLPPTRALAPMITPEGVAAYAVSPPPGPAVDPHAGYGRDPRYADPDLAPAAAAEHARHFLDRWTALAFTPPPDAEPPAEPVSVVALSAHDLARAWPAGGAEIWLARLLDLLAESRAVRAMSLELHLARNPVGVLGRPAAAVGGTLAARPADSDLYDRCRAAADLLGFALERRGALSPRERLHVGGMIRALLQAQRIDWSYPSRGGVAPDEGLRAAASWLARFHDHAAALMSSRPDRPRRGIGPVFLPDLELDDAAVL